MSDYWKKKLDELEQETKGASSQNYWQKKEKELKQEQERHKRNVANAKEKKEEEEKRVTHKVRDPFAESSIKTRVTDDDDDIAPVKKEEEEPNSWFKSSGLFDDGYDFGDISRTILGSAVDLGENIYAGIVGMGEKAVDAFASMAPYALQNPSTYIAAVPNEEIFKRNEKLFEEAKTESAKFIKQDLYDEQAIARAVITDNAKKIGIDGESHSVFAQKSDALAYSGGQLIGTVGLQAAGVPWWVTSATMSYGAEFENALNQGASYEAAGTSATVSAIAEVLSEKLFGGSGLGETGLIDTSKLTMGIADKMWKRLADYGVDMFFEGAEEVATDIASNLGSALYREENVWDILTNEEAIEGYIDSFFGGGALSGFMNSSKFVKSARKGTSYDANFTKNEQAVFDKEVSKRIAEAEKDGKKLTRKQKNAIRTQVEQDIETGDLSTDSIEEVLGGEAYKQYQDFVDSETHLKEKRELTQDTIDGLQNEFDYLNKMKQGEMTGEQIDRRAELKELLATERANLAQITEELESEAGRAAREQQRSQLKEQLSRQVAQQVRGDRLFKSYTESDARRQYFQDDLNKHTDPYARKSIENLMQSKTVNNARHSRALAETVAKIAADTKTEFRFVTKAQIKESGQSYHGNKTLTADGNTAVFDIGAKNIDPDVVVKIDGKAVENFEVDTEKGTITFDTAPAQGEISVEYEATNWVNGWNDGKGHITVNMESKRYWNYIVGHEITHSTEKTKHYTKMAKAVIEYAKKKGDYQSRLDALARSYNEGTDVEAELVADLVGDYIFSDYDFAKHLASSNQNIFQRMFSEIKHLLKMTTARSKEARMLERARYNFAKAYMEVGKAKSTSSQQTIDTKAAKDAAPTAEVETDTSGNEITDDDLEFLDREAMYAELDELYDQWFDLLEQQRKADEKITAAMDKGGRDIAAIDDYERIEAEVRETWEKIEALQEKLGGSLDQYGQKTEADSQRHEGAEAGVKTQYSLTTIEPVEPTSDNWSRGFTAEDVRAIDSNFRKSDAQNEYVEDKNPSYEERKAERISLAERTSAGKRGNGTQRANTASTYDKLYDTLEMEGFNGTILDASSGLGIGTDHGIQRGFDVEDIEPYYGEGYSPIFSDYSRLDKQYDVVISSAVINVLTQEDSDAMVAAIGNALNPGGRAFITVRSATSVDGSLKGGSSIRLSENAHEWYVPGSDNYQRGYETEELRAYLQDVLGEGYTVTSSPKYWDKAKGKWQKWGDTSALVTKDGGTKYSLSAEQQEYFKDSVVRDENGNLKVMYHGTSKGGHTVFDPWGASNYGLFGTGTYFTDSKTIGESYTKKGKGKNPQVYEAYLNIKNPLDMDANADPAQWQEAFPDADFPESGTNEQFYRAVEEFYADQMMPKWEVAEEIREIIEFGMGYDGITHIGGGRVNADGERHQVYIAFNPEQIKNVDNTKPTENPDIRYSLTEEDTQETNQKLSGAGLQYDVQSGTVYSLSSLEDAFDYNMGESEYRAAKEEYVNALMKVTGKTSEEANRYLNSLFLVRDLIAEDQERLGYDPAPNRTAWVSNAEYGGSIDFSTLCAKRRLFTGTFDAIQMALPDTVLNENDFLKIRDMLLKKGYESPCSMCYVEGSRAKHGVYVEKWLKEYLKTDPEWKPQIADFTSTTRLEQTRIQHPEAYAAYKKAMNALSQRKPKEASVRTDYKGEILRDFRDDSTVAEKNKNGGVRFNSFSDFEIVHALDAMQVITDMARVGLNGQAYTKVKEFAEAFGNTGLKINLSLVARDVDANGRLVMDETNGMNYAEAMDIRSRYSENVGTVIVVFNDAQLRAALADSSIDYVLPFHRSQWKKSQYTLMGLPEATRDYTNIQNERYKNPKTGRSKKVPTGNIMPNEYWDFRLSGRENAQKYLDYINEHSYIPKFDFLLDRVDGKWTLPDGDIGDGYFKLLIDFKMYDNDGWGSPQRPVLPEFNMPYIQQMLKDYKGGHQSFPVAHDVVSEFVESKKHSISNPGEEHPFYGNYGAPAADLAVVKDDAGFAVGDENATTAPVGVSEMENTTPSTVSEEERLALFPDELAPDAELENLIQQRDDLERRMQEAFNAGDDQALENIGIEYSKVMDRLVTLDNEIADTDTARAESFLDSDAPPEIEAPYYEDTEAVQPDDPMADRNIDDVGNRKVKAYMYENPDVKPFFQAEARVMLGDLGESIRGEKIYNGQVYYDSGGEKGWMGTSRQTTADIADLLDNYGYTYAQIEKGLNAIIEDNGKENNAVSKRIEFALNDRLLNGYTNVWGEQMPPDQDYVRFLQEKEITEYSQEAFESFMENADQYAPEEIAPLFATAEDSPVVEDIAPFETVNTDSMKGVVKGQETYITTQDKLANRRPAVGSDDIAPTFEVKRAPNRVLEGQKAMWEGIEKEFEAITPKKGGKLVRRTTASEKVAQILAEEPSPKNRRSRAWARFKANVFDKGAVFEDLSLKTRNRELMGKWNYILSSEARAQRLMGNGTAGVKSLNAIREQVESTGKTQQFYEYLYHRHNVDRMQLADRYEDTENKPVYGYTVTADKSQEIVNQFERSNPAFKQYARDVYAYLNHLRSLLVGNGVISQETADLWAEMYPHYVPIRRAGDEGLNINVPLDTRKTGVNAPVKRAKGGNSDILPLFDTMAQRTIQTYKAIAKNSFGVELKNALGSTIGKDTTSVDDVDATIDNQEGLLQKGKNGGNPTFTVFENGEKVTFEITEDMYDALKPVSGILADTYKPLNFASNFHRGLLTEYNPVFMLTNAIKDVQDVLINSQHPLRTYGKLPEAQWQILTKGYWYNEYMENGGEQNSYFDTDTNSFDTRPKGLGRLLDIPPLSTISKLNNFIEMAPRLAEYIASREAGRSAEVSMLDAARVTTNFAAGGDVTKFLNRNGATFLNASVQGVMQNVRNFREAKANGLKGWASLATKFTMAGLAAEILNNLLWDDDDDYEELSDYVKQNYYVVWKTEGGKFIRIPKGRTVAVIQNAVEQISNAATGDDEVDMKSFLELVVSNLAPNNPVEDNILAPIIQVAQNQTWYGEDLVPTRLQDLPAAEQYDESTDRFSKWLGEKLDISPVKINYLLDQYSGGLGDTFLPMLTPEAESGDNTFMGNMLAPLKSKFSTDSVLNNQNVSDFYDTMDELTTNAKSSVATDEDVLMSKYMNSVNSELSGLYAQKREIQNSNLSDDRKHELVRDTQQQIVDLMKEALGTYSNVNIDGDMAVIGDRYYKRNDDGEWQKLSDDQVRKYLITSAAGDASYATDGTLHYRREADGSWTKISDRQLERQKEVTEALGITPEEYWSKTDISFLPMSDGEYEYGFDNPGKYAVSKAVFNEFSEYERVQAEINTIKENNDSDSGTADKDLVTQYIFGLDIDYGQQAILYRSLYGSKADKKKYNLDIVEYLNSRSDISFEDTVAILEELGMTVDEEGNVYW